MSTDERITELEIRLTHQQRWIDEMNAELLGAREEIELLKKKLERMEQILAELVADEELPPSEKPPHY